MFLALLGVAAARPQFMYPLHTPLVTVKAADDASKVVTPLTYTYPTTSLGTYPLSYTGWPYTMPSFPFSPIITTNPVAEKTVERAKRSADPEPQPDPEADPLMLYTSGVVPSTIPFAGTTAYNYPAAIPIASTYSTFPNFPLTYTNFPYTYPFNYAKVVKTA